MSALAPGNNDSLCQSAKKTSKHRPTVIEALLFGIFHNRQLFRSYIFYSDKRAGYYALRSSQFACLCMPPCVCAWISVKIWRTVDFGRINLKIKNRHLGCKATVYKTLTLVAAKKWLTIEAFRPNESMTFCSHWPRGGADAGRQSHTNRGKHTDGRTDKTHGRD